MNENLNKLINEINKTMRFEYQPNLFNFTENKSIFVLDWLNVQYQYRMKHKFIF